MLQKLESLNLSMNTKINNKDMTSIFKLKNIKELILRDCNLRKGILNKVKNVPEKERKNDMKKNTFDKSSGFGIFIRLEKLDLSHNNKLAGRDFMVIFQFTNLKELDLSFCNLSSCDLPGIEKLKKLERLNLAGNLLGGFSNLDYVFEILSLKYLDLSFCRLLPKSLENIGKLTNLMMLGLEGNIRLLPTDLERINDIKNLKVLDIRNCHISSILLNSPQVLF